MKIVMAIIKPFKLDEVRDALTNLGVHGAKRVTPKSIAARNML
jgi:nitrogen regulatory protein PII